MYNSYFGFREKPFKLVPNPDYLYLSKSHEIALAHLTYATDQGEGFVVITGEVGTGKTTLCRNYLESLDEQTSSAYIFNPRLDSSQLLGSICSEFGISTSETRIKALIDELNTYLIEQNAAGRKVVLLIDEAQGLSVENLELVRMLSNLETTRSKLLQIILVGQPELGDLLDSYELRQLAQRISLNYHLSPLSAKEAEAYILHRLKVATKNESELFSPNACRAAFHYAGGIPRLINIVCDRALLLAFTNNRSKVTKGVMQSAIRELMSRGGQAKRVNPNWWPYLFAGSALLAVVAVVIALFVWRSNTQMRKANMAAQPAGQVAAPAELPVPATFKVQAPPEEETAETAAMEPAPPESDEKTPEPQPEETPASALAMTSEAVPEQPAAPAPQVEPPGRQEAAAEDMPSPEPGPPAETVAGEAPSTEPPAASEDTVSSSDQAQIVPIDKIVAALDPKISRKQAASVLLTLWQQPRPNLNLLPEQLEDAMFYDLAARQYGLRAYATQWDWSLLQRLDLPAILAMKKTDDTKHVYLAVIKGDQGTLMLSQGDASPAIEVDLNTLTPYLAGPMYVYWRNAIGFDMLIGHGANRNAVLGVKNLLRRIGYQDVPLTPVFDNLTQETVKSFQARNALEADGLVGPLTKIMLLREAGTQGMPHLLGQKRSVP